MAGSEAAICSSANSSGRYSLAQVADARRARRFRRGEGVGRCLRLPCGRNNAPRLEIGRQKRGRAFPGGGGGGGDGWVSPSSMALFCANGWRCVQHSVGKGRLWSGKRPPNGDRAAETRHCVSRGVGVAGMGGLRLAAWRTSTAMRAVQRLKRPPCGWDSAPRLDAGQQKSGRASPVCGALLTISDQSGHMLVHQS